jgi:hypothetical protein
MTACGRYESTWVRTEIGGLRGLRLHIDWGNERFALAGIAEPTAPQRQVRRAEGSGGPQIRRVAPGDGPRFGISARPSPGGEIQILGTEPGSPAAEIRLER